MHTALAQMRIYTRCGIYIICIPVVIYMYALRCALQETTQVTSHKSQVTSQMNVARLMHMRDDPRHTNQTDDRVQVMPNERVQVISTSSQMNVSKSSQMNVSKSCHTHTHAHTHTHTLSLSLVDPFRPAQTWPSPPLALCRPRTLGMASSNRGQTSHHWSGS